MKKSFSISTLLIWALVAALVTSLVSTNRKLKQRDTENTQLRSELRGQINHKSYTSTGRMIVDHNKVVVYTLKTESTFCHAIHIVDIEGKTVRIIVNSYVHPTSNLWTTELYVIGVRGNDYTEYSLSKNAEYSSQTPISIGKIENKHSSMEGFSSTGILDEKLTIPIWVGGRIPFELKLEGESNPTHRSSEEIIESDC